jgi:microcystin degradation protein MlrC
MRIGYAGFQHESNSFAHGSASLEKWKESGILYGDLIRAEYETSRATIAGYYGRYRDESDVELVPLVFARLTPMGQMSVEATKFLFEAILTSISENGPWDAILLPLHGAAVSDLYLDADGELVKQVRDLVGPDVTIGTSLDMHANISHSIVDYSDVVTAYQTNPHIDTYEQAYRAADIVLGRLRGEVSPTSYLATPPLIVNILRQGTSDEPMATILKSADEARKRDGVLYVGVVEGYPYSDVPEMGMTFIAITDNDPLLAREIANSIATVAWNLREALQGGAVEIEAALVEASQSSDFPVILFDVGDNVGAGTPGDSTFVLHAARKLGVQGVVQALCDPEVALLCHKLGVGAEITTEVGSKADSMHGEPFAIHGRITALSDGKYEESKASHGGFRFYDDGNSATIETDDGFKLLLTSLPAMSSSLEQFRAVGIDPSKERIVVVKGVHSPRPAYEPIAAKMIWLATPGASTADLTNFTYKNRRIPLYPFEEDTKWNPYEPSNGNFIS